MKNTYGFAALCAIASLLLASCGPNSGDAYSPNQGVKLEDAQNKDMQFNSAMPNGSPNTPPSEMSASPNGQSQGATPQF